MKNVALFLSILFVPFLVQAGEIRERGTNRAITYAVDAQKQVANFTLRTDEGSEDLKSLDLKRLSPESAQIENMPRTRKISEGYSDVTDFLIQNLDMGIIFLFPLSGAVYAGYSLSYLYTLPADLLSVEHRAHRKFVKLIDGKNVTASHKVFERLLTQLKR